MITDALNDSSFANLVLSEGGSSNNWAGLLGSGETVILLDCDGTGGFFSDGDEDWSAFPDLEFLENFHILYGGEISTT